MTGRNQDSAASSDEAAVMQAKVAILADADSYPGQPEGAHAIEIRTH